MNDTMLDTANLKEMQDNIRREVRSLEKCWKCERICSCEKWILDGTVIIWLCGTCVT